MDRRKKTGEGEEQRGRGRGGVKKRENFFKKIWRRRGTVRVREYLKKWKMKEGELEGERG
jgi:hypothetical protein